MNEPKKKGRPKSASPKLLCTFRLAPDVRAEIKRLAALNRESEAAVIEALVRGLFNVQKLAAQLVVRPSARPSGDATLLPRPIPVPKSEPNPNAVTFSRSGCKPIGRPSDR